MHTETRETERNREGGRGRFRSKAVEKDFQEKRGCCSCAMASDNARNKSATASAEQTVDMPHEEFEPALWWPECCIYEVPESLRKCNPDAYTPQLISIGPIHYNEEKLKPMEKQKKLYYHYFQRRLLNIQKKALTDYKTFLESTENHIRRCYSNSEKCDIPKDEFVGMILLDAVFIMELFLRKFSVQSIEHENDLLFSKLWIAGGIRRDLLLLENQLPMFVLAELYNKVVPDFDKHEHHSFHKLACDYFATLNPSLGRVRVSDDILKIYKNSEHFTDLIRYCCLPSDQELKQGERHSDGDLKTARKLNEAGVTFEKIRIRPLLAIEFKKEKFLNKFPCLSTIPMIKSLKSRFRIPQLTVDDATEILLRNLIALEQCHYPKKDYICNYVVLMDSLIDTKEDVDFLVDNQVIVQNVGSNEEVATMFNSLAKHVYISSFCYAEIIDKLNGHYNNGWNHTMAKLKSVYFCDLWRGSATVVGLAVFFFSVFNTVRAFLKNS